MRPPTGNGSAIVVEGLTKSFGPFRAVDDLSFEVKEGEIFGFLGANGAGKSTTIRMLVGLLEPSAGRAVVGGFDVMKQTDLLKAGIGYMSQKFSLYDDLTVEQNVRFFGGVYRLPAALLRERFDWVIEMAGLRGRERTLTGTLSGGWKQRLALAACILHEPELLLLDEPTAGVDPKARREFWDEIHRLAAQGLTVLVSTHYMDEAERCHEIAYIAYGKLIARGTVAEVIGRSGLATWSVEGDGLGELAERLRETPGVDMVAAFGTALHVCAMDAAALERAIAPYRGDSRWHWQRSEPSLEDVFIQLMAQSQKEQP